MPKRKRRAKDRRAVALAPSSVKDGEDSSSSELPDEGDEDLEFLQDSLAEGRAGFLTKMKLGGQSQSGKSKCGTKEVNLTDDDKLHSRRLEDTVGAMEGDSEEEAEFEATPRPSKWEGGGENQELHYLLPLKGKHGRLIQQQPTVITTAEDSDEEVISSEGEESDSKDQSENEPETGVPENLSAAELFARRQAKLTEKKEMIAEIALLVIENPEENIDKLKKLRSLCAERDPDVAITIRKAAMVSLMTVLKDIAPSYHIRELKESEKAVKVSKDVRRLRRFEQTLLMDYQLFLTLLDDAIKIGLGESQGDRKKRRERKRPLAELDSGQVLPQQSLQNLARVALKCLCELLLSLPHFNFRNNILTVLVPRMNSKALGGEVSKQCCETIETLFDNDIVGEVSLEAVRLIVKMVKAKSYKTKSAVLRTFLHLQLHSIDNPVAAAGSRSTRTSKEERKREKAIKMTSKRRRRLRAEAKLERDLREAEAVENKEYKSKLQTEILKLVFLIYFRILKHSRHSPLLQPVLEGLAKFAHLINVDFFSDLMSVLHSLAETGGLSNRECMQCVLAAFEILSGQGAALQIDPRQFYTQLYGVITHLDVLSGDRDVKLAVECLDCMVRKRRQISTQRVLGFVKRLSTVSAQLVPGACLAVMATTKKFIQMYSQCEQLLSVEESAAGGVFRPDVPDPEMSHASSTALWELSLLRTHYHPVVCSYAGFLLSGAPSQGKGCLQTHLLRKSPAELLADFSLDNSSHVTRPLTAVPSPPPHPATKRAQKRKKEWSDYYYRDNGISLSELRQLEQEALQFCDGVIFSSIN